MTCASPAAMTTTRAEMSGSDAVRRALAKIDESEGLAWLQAHFDYCVLPLLNETWALDVDSTVKPLYGEQEGEVVSYNPHKPGRPSLGPYIGPVFPWASAETKDFDGVKASWMRSMSLEALRASISKPYTMMETNRASKYLYEKGKPVFLLAPPEVVYVMQSYTYHVDKGLSMDKLSDLGSKLKLPEGWMFKTTCWTRI